MASIKEFLTNEIELQKEIKYRDDISEFQRVHEFVVARRIQAWFRGLLTRNHLRMLHKSATIIQKNWRGFMARKSVKSYLKDRVMEMWRQYYHRCATKIQALWRGYKSRKNGVDLLKYRQWLQTVYDKNDQALTKMKEFRSSESTHRRNVMEHESMLWMLFILFKLHHLLRTKSQPGVLTRIDKTRFTSIERMTRSLEYTLYMENRRRDKCNQEPPHSPPLLLEGTYFARCEKEIRDLERSIEMGKASIRRDAPYEGNEKFSKKLEGIREESISGNNFNNLPFRTITDFKTPCACDSTVRVTLGDYNPPKSGFTSIRPQRDKSKELDGDFKAIFKPNELYEAINKMDCPFHELKLKCPIHDLIAE